MRKEEKKRKKRKKNGLNSTAPYLSRAGGPRPLNTQYSKWDFTRAEGWMLRILRNNWCFWLTVNEWALGFSYRSSSCFFTLKGNNLHLSVYRKYNIKVHSVLNVLACYTGLQKKKKVNLNCLDWELIESYFSQMKKNSKHSFNWMHTCSELHFLIWATKIRVQTQ